MTVISEKHTRDKWQLRFMNLAFMVASWSKDPNRKVGTVLVSPDGRKISYGYNGFPKGNNWLVSPDGRKISYGYNGSPKDNDWCESIVEDTDLKNSCSIHAEINAILNARTDVSKWTLYCTSHPCSQCVSAIIQSGICRVVVPKTCLDPNSKWFDSQLLGTKLLQNYGIPLVIIDYKREEI